jgi:AhpD family alkylhydroperoxidase
MTRLDAIDPQQASAQVAPMFEGVRRSLGLVPNMFRTMAQSPAVFQGYLGLSGALRGGSLAPALGEQIALRAAELNACGYCAAAHTALARGAGLTDGDIEAAREGRAGEPRAEAALRLAGRILATRGHVDEADVRAARDAGLSQGEVAEVVAHVALNVFTNYFNSLARTEVDFPAVRAPALAGTR